MISVIDLIATANSLETKKEDKVKKEKIAKLFLKEDKQGSFIRFTGIDKSYKGFLFSSDFKDEKGKAQFVVGFVKDESLIDARKSPVKKVFRISSLIRTNNTLKSFLEDVLKHTTESVYVLTPLKDASDIFTLALLDGEEPVKIRKVKSPKVRELGPDGLPKPKRKYTKRS